MNLTKMARLEHGGKIKAHHPSLCAGAVCCLHNRSQHAMRGWPQLWREDRGIMERVCQCGIGHPDVDDRRVLSGEDDGVHGCCGHCRPTLAAPAKDK
jgi:hypothetical protein